MKINKLIVIVLIALVIVILLSFAMSANYSKGLYSNFPNGVTEPTTFISASPTSMINTSIIENASNNITELQPINGDDVFNRINWSKYHGIDRIRVHDNEISEPTFVINHPFIYFTVDVVVKDPENTNELYREMAGVVIEIRQIIGPNSSISVWGIYDGIDRFCVGMLPYEDRLYASDHYHPQAYKNDISIIPGTDIYDHHSYTIINNSVIEP